jgi:hypothetical protein
MFFDSFNRTYDPDADGERMDALGLFSYFRDAERE